MFATDKGDLFGRNFFDILKAFDEKITKRMKSLQKRNIRPRSDKKYRKYVNNLRELLKNEINRLINIIIKIYKPKRIIIERLDFRSLELSKRMNRMLQNFGKRYIKEKLQRLQQLYGIEIIEINPAYTSQECSSCGYVDKSNRKDTQGFECKVCGNKTNAQVNVTLTKKQVLKMLIERYLERLKGRQSPPLDVIRNNPYFKDYLDSILNPRQS